MKNNDLLDVALTYLQQKGILTDLEKDLLATIGKYTEKPCGLK